MDETKLEPLEYKTDNQFIKLQEEMQRRVLLSFAIPKNLIEDMRKGQTVYEARMLLHIEGIASND